MDKQTKEVRYIALDAQIRASDEDGDKFVRGYAAVFDSWSEDLGGFVERIKAGAFARSIKQNDVLALWQHREHDPIGRTGNGLVALSEDEKGLAFEIKASAFSPRQLEKIRDGKVQAAGAVIGAVMKSMGGKADAARVRELVLERASASS